MPNILLFYLVMSRKICIFAPKYKLPNMESKKFVLGKELAWMPSGKGMERHIMGYVIDTFSPARQDFV